MISSHENHSPGVIGSLLNGLLPVLVPVIGMASRGASKKQDAKFEKDLITGLISLILLAVLEAADEPLYGYQIAKRMEADESAGISLKQGTIYPVLRSLEKKGLLKSKIKASESGPPRKYYQITKKGKEKLEIWEGSWNRMRTYVDSVLEGDGNE